MFNRKEHKMSNQAKTVRTSLGLRDTLFDEIDNLRNGKSNPAVAGAMAKLAVQIINTVNMEVNYQRHVASMPNANNGMNTTPLKLSS